MKNLAILGSTGSIGKQALDVIRLNKYDFNVVALACGKNIELMKEQIREFNPVLVAVEMESDAISLSKEFPNIEIFFGKTGLELAATCPDADLTFNSVMGMRGMMPTYKAIKAGKKIALANKETLVAGGKIIMDALAEANTTILPVDSEHSAIFQAIQGKSNKIKRIILTASGGPFRNRSLEELGKVTLEEALEHPNWSMGKKITIDSATMMNKGLEVIEAKWLFDVDVDNIEVHVHPQSVVHSAVEFFDSSVIAQMGVPDMKVPISYALTYPDRRFCDSKSLDLFLYGNLSFEKPDLEVFKCLKLAFEAIRLGKSYPATLNGANEVLVDKFLNGKIKFIDIQNTLFDVMNSHVAQEIKSIEDVEAVDMEIRSILEKTL